MTSGGTKTDCLDRFVDSRVEPLRQVPLFDRAMYVLTQSANHSFLWHGINVVRLATSRPQGRQTAVHLALTLGIESALVNGPIKRAFRRNRPVHEVMHRHKLRTPRTTSFPSGHATSAFCAAALFSDGGSRSRKVAWYALASGVAYSRVHVRLHHATDVVGGALIGYLFGKLACALRQSSSSNDTSI